MIDSLIEELIRTVFSAHPSTLKRMRFAVSPEEFREIGKYMFDRDRIFYGRIANVPLIVEDDPENPPLIEHR